MKKENEQDAREKNLQRLWPLLGCHPTQGSGCPTPVLEDLGGLEQGQWSQSLSLHSFHGGVGDPGDLQPYHRLKPQIHVKSGISIEECSYVKEGSVPKAISLLLP